MSASADDLAALSPAERDFALRRMPVETLAESYRAASEAPPHLGAPLVLAAFDRPALLRCADRLADLATRLYRQHDYRSSHNALQIERDIREALK